MRYPPSEKLEIIRLVERSHLPVRRTLDKLGIPATTFYRWYDRFLAFGDAGLEDRNSSPGRVWNRIPDDVRGQIIDLALEETQLSPRELAVRFTDTRESIRNFVLWAIVMKKKGNGMDASHPLMPEVARVEVDPHRPTASKCQVGRASSSQANRRVQDED